MDSGEAVTLCARGLRADDQDRLVTWEQALLQARLAFNPVERAMFRMLGIRQFLLLQR
jgi:hypothetical protein